MFVSYSPIAVFSFIGGERGGEEVRAEMNSLIVIHSMYSPGSVIVSFTGIRVLSDGVTLFVAEIDVWSICVGVISSQLPPPFSAVVANSAISTIDPSEFMLLIIVSRIHYPNWDAIKEFRWTSVLSVDRDQSCFFRQKSRKFLCRAHTQGKTANFYLHRPYLANPPTPCGCFYSLVLLKNAVLSRG